MLDESGDISSCHLNFTQENDITRADATIEIMATDPITNEDVGIFHCAETRVDVHPDTSTHSSPNLPDDQQV